MHKTLRVATAVAVISVGGLVGSQVALGAEAPNVGEDWAFFTGRVLGDGTPLPIESRPIEENGLFVHLEGGGWSGQTMTTDDPRMTGKRTERINGFENALDGSTAGMFAGLVTIENADGSWTCPSYWVVVDPAPWELSGWCEGAGAYEGLRSFVRYEASPGNMWLDVYGFITSADGPPMPEAPAS